MSRPIKHGMSHSRLYKCWVDMKARCLNPNHNWYSHYGGKGITVCDEWKDFIPFMEWAHLHGYSDELTLDRIDNQGNYEPSNCRWATQQQQSLNKAHLPSKTGYVGVRIRKDCGKYQAEVWEKCKYYYVGLFDNPKEAFKTRCSFIKEHGFHGESACQ